MRKHLIYYICPFKSNTEWKKNAESLIKYIDIFDGTKIVNIATGRMMADPIEVKKSLDLENVDYRIIDNDPDLCETKPFLPTLEKLQSGVNGEEGITFYAHAKGVTPGKSRSELESVRVWRRYMYHYCLGDQIKIDYFVKEYPCLGCFKKHGEHHLPMKSSWHFSGTFFWFKNDELFDREWKRIDKNRYGVEGYLSNIFESKEAYCLFGNDPFPSNLYKYSKKDWQQFYERDKIGGVFGRNKSIPQEYKKQVSKKYGSIECEEEADLFLRREGVKKRKVNKWMNEHFE